MNLVVFIAGHAIERVFRFAAHLRRPKTPSHTYTLRDQLREDINDGR